MTISKTINPIKAIANHIGKEYVNRKLEEATPEIEQIYRDIVATTEKLFNELPFDVVFTDDDPYKSCEEMTERVRNEGVMYIYKGGSDHPYYSYEENWMGRAVHDYHHMITGGKFNFEGEYKALMSQLKHYPEHTHSVLFSEVIGQTCGYIYSGYKHNFPQRAIKAPWSWMEMCKMVFGK